MPKLKNPNTNTRTTVIVPETLDRNLALWCAQTGSTRSEIITKLLTDFLASEGYQPNKHPRVVEVRY